MHSCIKRRGPRSRRTCYTVIMGLTPLALFEIIGVIILLAVIAYWGGNIFLKARAAKLLIEEARPYTLATNDTTKTLLVLGDSTGVGVGATTPAESVPGLLAAHLGATHVENYSVSGAGVEDLASQIEQAQLARYDVIFLMIGANNILAFDNPRWAARELGEMLASLPESGGTYLMAAGNVGGATIFPHPVRFFHTRTTLAYHKEFARAAHAWNATYINLYEKPSVDPFMKEPNRYLAADGLHPTSEGYALWFGKLKQEL